MQEIATAIQQTRAWACYDCGKCTATCPVTRAGGECTPRKHILAANLRQPQEIVHSKSLFNCLTCAQCDLRCPAQVAYTDLVQQLRALAYREGIEPECPHGGALQSVMRMMAGGGTRQDRLKWLNPDLKTSAEKGDVFYWTGCTMYYDTLFPELGVTTLNGNKAALRVMNKLGIQPVVSGEERCCGHDLLWNGDRTGFEALARHNIDLVTASGAKTLVASCAECVRTWKLDYAPMLGSKAPRIYHITEFLTGQLQDLKFKSNGRRRITYQDPCRLGRHLGVYDPPRELLAALPGVELAEMKNSGRSALCCAGGTWTNCDRFAKQIQVDRLREARSTGADMMVTACPKCQIHFRCAMKDPNLKSAVEIEMRDIVELVGDALA
jgi:heterodisulfide reductase subunit D